MRILEELTGTCDITESDISAAIPRVMAAAFEGIIHKKCVWEQFYRDNRDILGKPGKEVVFLQATPTNKSWKWDVPECTDITGVTGATVGIEGYTATTIGVKKLGGWFAISREAIKFSQRDVLKDDIYETGLQYAEAIDDAAYNQIMFGQYTTPSPSVSTIGTDSLEVALSENVIQINDTDIPKASISAIDYCKGTLYVSGTLGATATVSFTEGTEPGLCVSAAEPGEKSTYVSPWGILDGKAAMISNGYDPDVVVINYADLPYILYDEKVKFLDASAYGEREPLLNAEIGRLWGLKVITDVRHIPQGCGLLIDTDRMGWDVHKQELTSYREDKYERDAVFYYFYAERGFGVKDTLSLCKVIGGTPDYPGTHPAN